MQQEKAERLKLLETFFRRLTEKTGNKVKAPINLVYEYLMVLSVTKSNLPNEAAVEAAYRPVFTDTAFKYIVDSVYNKNVLDVYTKMLDRYQTVVGKTNNPAEVARVAALSKGFQIKLEKLRQADEITTQIGKQQLIRGPAQAPY